MKIAALFTLASACALLAADNGIRRMTPSQRTEYINSIGGGGLGAPVSTEVKKTVEVTPLQKAEAELKELRADLAEYQADITAARRFGREPRPNLLYLSRLTSQMLAKKEKDVADLRAADKIRNDGQRYSVTASSIIVPFTPEEKAAFDKANAAKTNSIRTAATNAPSTSAAKTNAPAK